MAELTLKWEKFGLSRMLHEMLASRELVDVTLACQKEFVKAHRAVLAASSPYFREIFKDNPCNHPVVVLQDINLSHLKLILQFIYIGEVTVLQDHLPDFLHTAELLGITALAPKAKEQTSLSSLLQPEVLLEDSGPTIKRRRRNLKHTPTKNMPSASALEPTVVIDDKPPEQKTAKKSNLESEKSHTPALEEHPILTADVSDLGLYSSEEAVMPEEVKLEIDEEAEFVWPMSPLGETETMEQDSRPAEISTDELSNVEAIPMDPIETVNIKHGGGTFMPNSSGKASGSSKQGQSSSQASQSQHQKPGSWAVTSQNLRPILPRPSGTGQVYLDNNGMAMIPTLTNTGKKQKRTPPTASETSTSQPGGSKGAKAKTLKQSTPTSGVTKVTKVRERLLKCLKCGIAFTSRALRIEHEAKMHPTVGTLVTCEFCHRKFNHNKSLCTHRRLYHTGPEAGVRHVCKTCGVSYALKGDLKTHERNIHGDLAIPHRCEICFKVFKNRRYCHSHMRVIHQMRSVPETSSVPVTNESPKP